MSLLSFEVHFRRSLSILCPEEGAKAMTNLRNIIARKQDVQTQLMG